MLHDPIKRYVGGCVVYFDYVNGKSLCLEDLNFFLSQNVGDLENVIVAQTLSTNEVNRDDNFELENSDSDSLGNDVYSSECESDLDEFEDPDYEVIEDDVLFSKFVDHDVRDGSEILNNDMSFFTSESLNAQLNDGQGENDVILSDGEGFDSDTHCSGNEDVGRGS
ncbi:hypothetical protein LIER_26971 [Lithospermum erythrorhizon]|uniref:Uncharacterized protein n=1 Tax=Lithospermum erythrorhizon TaxID=34254 RepID=A0AAV3RAB7_LITER